jgi:seryl-tRNA synthetase
MLDIKFVRENSDIVKENIKKKFQDEKLPLVDEVITLDKEYREVKTKLDELRSERNKKSASIGSLMREGKREEAEGVKEEVSKINEEIAKDENFSVKAFCSWADQKGLLDCNNKGKNQKVVRVGNDTKRFYSIKIVQEADKQDDPEFKDSAQEEIPFD